MPTPNVHKNVAVKVKKIKAEDPEAPMPAVVGKAFGIVRKDVGATALPKKRKKGSRGTY